MTQEEFHKRYQYNPNTACLGEGGFGKVYKAYDSHLDRYVALKIAEVKLNYESVRLKKEVELINKLPTHPNIAHYEECFSFSTYTGESDYGILQYYEHGNLQQLLTDKQLSYEQKDSILKQILEGIAFLHSQGIIHRDLKPQNILIALNQNGQYIPKITDFGISKKIDSNKSSAFTNSLSGIGTLAYASPEQLRGLTISKNTDLWSFGILVCWMLTGKLPFNSGSHIATSEAGRIELFKQITTGNVSLIIQQLPVTWQNLIKLCIVLDVDKRITSADKCLEMLILKAVATTKNEILKDNNQTLQATNNKTITYIEESKIQLLTADEYFKRAQNKRENSNYESAIDDYNNAIKLNPNESNYYFFKAICEYEKGDYEKSINDNSKVIELHPKNNSAYFNRGLSYEKIKKNEKASNDYFKAYSLNSDTLYFDNWLRTAIESNDLLTTSEYLNNSKWAKRDIVFFSRGVIYNKIGELEKTIADFSSAIQIKSEKKYIDNFIDALVRTNDENLLSNYIVKNPLLEERICFGRGCFIQSKNGIENKRKVIDYFYRAYQLNKNAGYEKVYYYKVKDDIELLNLYLEKDFPNIDCLYYERALINIKLGNRQQALSDVNESKILGCKEAESYKSFFSSPLIINFIVLGLINVSYIYCLVFVLLWFGDFETFKSEYLFGINYGIWGFLMSCYLSLISIYVNKKNYKSIESDINDKNYIFRSNLNKSITNINQSIIPFCWLILGLVILIAIISLVFERVEHYGLFFTYLFVLIQFVLISIILFYPGIKILNRRWFKKII